MDSLFLLTFYCIVTEYVRKIRKKFSLEPHFLFAIEIKHYNRCISKGTGKRDIFSNDLRISSFDERERLKIYGYSKDDFWQKIWPIFSTFMKYLVVLTSMDKIIDQTKMPTKNSFVENKYYITNAAILWHIHKWCIPHTESLYFICISTFPYIFETDYLNLISSIILHLHIGLW